MRRKTGDNQSPTLAVPQLDVTRPCRRATWPLDGSLLKVEFRTERIREKLVQTGIIAREFNVTALFGGVGALECGLAAAGHHASHFCEIDPEAATVLRARFPTRS